ncbi:GNAT family N-acetyltransferase [Flavivirga spongiicola]|uniref:GNAT family N-acetyltransferase n=1 Tax=Flavivirga spongiicola TaxID=421621 RepID=A0ABU7XXK9_9FLAO|nr:GNAT family N-acetyltransferase [Flavivirga sp. MEBiC05379]MDO5980529.1 GNAT family N-acetyltransferase [Flavivirga sp. MEBiC05379]
MYDIKLIDNAQMGIIIPFLKELKPDVSVASLEERLKDMLLNNYKCVGIFDDQKLIGISGLWVLTKYYVGKHIEPDNVFISPEYQGKGIGKLLVDWIFKYAKSIGCEASELNCYVKNERGRRFWESQGYELVAYHFQKQL